MSPSHLPSSVRQLVYDRAAGCCEYCLIPETAVLAVHQIDHIISKKHGGSDEVANLALSCVLCNKHKGSDLTSIDPDTGKIVPLYHPRQDKWADHFELQEAQFIGLTPTGRVTIRLLQFNRPDRVEERQLLIAAKVFKVKK
jgi:5-methylcytosine-specific restriction endonuclease McrA